MKLIAPRMEAVPTIDQPEDPQVLSGAALERQRHVVGPAGRGRAALGQEARDRIVSPPTGSSQNDRALTRGKAMSSAPICSGTK